MTNNQVDTILTAEPEKMLANISPLLLDYLSNFEAKYNRFGLHLD